MSATTTEEGQMAGAGEDVQGQDGAVDANGDGDERKSLSQLASEEPDEEREIEQYTLFGTAPRINGSVKGPRIGAAAIKFTAKREKLPGQFDMGEVVRGTFVGTVTKVHFDAKTNSDGSLEVTRVHTVSLERVSQAEDVPDEFSTLDGRGTDPERDAELDRLRARVTELEDLLEK